MAHDVFISYASADKQVADAVCAKLESQEIRCWIAPRDVLPGIHYGEAIIDAIHECRIMVLVFSAKANASPHIPKEIERAVSQGVTVMPLRIEDVLPTKSLDYFIGSVHWLDALTPPLEAHLQRLAANVKTLLSRSDSASPLRPVPAHSTSAHPIPLSTIGVSRPVRASWPSFVIGGLSLIVIVLGVLTYRSKIQGKAAPPEPIASVATPLPARVATAAGTGPEKPKKSLTPVSSSAMAPTSKVPAAAPPARTGGMQPIGEVALQYIPESTVRLEQLIGDQDKQLRRPTNNQTFTRFGIEGTELGYSFEHQGHAYFLFGPTVGRVPHEPNTMATTATVNPEGGVNLDFVTSGGNYIPIQLADTTARLLDVPVGGISIDRQMYVAMITNFVRGQNTDRSVLTKFVAPSTFQSIRTISQLPAGRFIRMSMHAQPNSVSGLPAGGPFIFVWGTGKNHESDAYLSIVPASQFESGKGTRYFAGLDTANTPSWSDNESDATPILKDGTLGNVSVTWCKDLGLWLMTYDRRTQPMGIAFSYSRTPWGPWSEPQILFNAVRDNGFGKFIHNPRRKIDDGLAGPVMGRRNAANADEIHGGAYAPFVVERWTKVQGKTLNLYYVMSTGNPYLVVLMESRLQIE
jgi:hypothetical protein